MILESRPALVTLALVALVLVTALALGAGAALASEGDMSGMPGMTDEEMQQMEPPSRQRKRTATGRRRPREPAATKRTRPPGRTRTWPACRPTGSSWAASSSLIAGTTLAAAATKRHLRRRMATGELAGAGALDV